MRRRALRWLVVAMMLWLAACAGSPAREQAETMRLKRQADISYQGGRFDIARKQYETLLSLDPQFATGYVRLGVIDYHEGHSGAARTNFENALQLDPRNEQARYNLAMLHLNNAAALLRDYVRGAPAAANRDQVLVLMSQLQAFGNKQ